LLNKEVDLEVIDYVSVFIFIFYYYDESCDGALDYFLLISTEIVNMNSLLNSKIPKYPQNTKVKCEN